MEEGSELGFGFLRWGRKRQKPKGNVGGGEGRGERLQQSGARVFELWGQGLLAVADLEGGAFEADQQAAVLRVCFVGREGEQIIAGLFLED